MLSSAFAVILTAHAPSFVQADTLQSNQTGIHPIATQQKGQQRPQQLTQSITQPITQQQAAATSQVGQLELVANLDITPGNVTVSRTGRMFASVHGLRRGSAQLIEIKPGTNQWKAFPDASWNAAPGSGANVLNTAHGVAIDDQDRLWVIDHGNWMPN
ncbi:MAG: hypothetical protein MUF49_20805, partial [Oculatellaceae cyanobacterium Prado106]|nr:hypothetical protein [Oculatellaceae cyanobacterium Prado106]